MPRKFIPFGKLEPHTYFEIHEQTWIKSPETATYGDIVYNAYSLDNTNLNARNRGTVEVKVFDDAVLVQVDTKRPPAKIRIEVLYPYDNDN